MAKRRRPGRPREVIDPKKRMLRLGAREWRRLRALTAPGSWTRRLRELVDLAAGLELAPDQVWCEACLRVHRDAEAERGEPREEGCGPGTWAAVYIAGERVPERWRRARE